MAWKLFLDDIREINWVFPNAEEGEFMLARNHWDVRRLINEMQSLPNYIAFDHDLGMTDSPQGRYENPTGFDVAIEIIAHDQDGDYKLPEDFDFSIHSANPVGAENIKGLLNNYLKFKDENPDITEFDLMEYRFVERAKSCS